MNQRPAIIAIIACISCLLFLGCNRSEEQMSPATIIADQARVPTVGATPARVATASDTPTASQPKAAAVERAQTRAFLRASPGGKGVLVEIVLDQVENLYGAEVHLVFDPTVVQVEDADPDFPGVQLAPGLAFPKGRSFAALNRADNDKGTIDFAATLLNPAPPIEGDTMIASFVLLPAKATATEIRVVQVLLADRNGNPLRVATESLHLDVRP